MFAEKKPERLELGDFVAQKLPHYHRRGSCVYFMTSPRPALELQLHEIELFNGIDGNRNVTELEEIYAGATERLRYWRDAGLLELIPPIAPPASPHLVVVEPHMDDAILGVGGRLLHRRGKSRITILSIVKWSAFTSHSIEYRRASSIEDVTNLREKEAALACRILGAEHRSLEWLDSPLRVIPPNSWSKTVHNQYAKSREGFTKLFPSPTHVSLLARQLYEALRELRPDELWIPIGLGDHVDHRITRNACLRMLADSHEVFDRVAIDMYEDESLGDTLVNGQQIRDALAQSGTRLTPMQEEIADVLPEKIRIAAVYASQYKRSFIDSLLRNKAKRVAGKEKIFAEAFYRIEGRVHVPLESEMHREKPGLTTLCERAVRLQNERRDRRLTVIALPSGHLGQWSSDVEFLRSTFPDFDFRAYVADDCAWQISDRNNVDLTIVRRNEWLGVISREFFRFGCSTVVLWRGAYGVGLQKRFRGLIALGVRGIHALIRCLLPFREVLFAKSLSDLCGVLAENMKSNACTEGTTATRAECAPRAAFVHRNGSSKA